MKKSDVSGRIATQTCFLAVTSVVVALSCQRRHLESERAPDFDASTVCNPSNPSGSSTDTDVRDAHGEVRIHDIQGTAHRSPFEGRVVKGVGGIVTALRRDGFYFQDLEPDDDTATSEGIFVFTNRAPEVAVGDAVIVDGTVVEYRQGCSRTCNETEPGFANLTTTEIVRPSRIDVTSSGNVLPLPVILGADGRAVPATIYAIGDEPDVEALDVRLDPVGNALDFYESVEGMRVDLRDAVVVSPTREFSESTRELVVLPNASTFSGQLTARGGVLLTSERENPERLVVTNAIVPEFPALDVSARFSGSIVGVLDYSFGRFTLSASSPLPPAVSHLERETTRLGESKPSEITLATLNVENLAATDTAMKFTALARLVVSNLASPDLLVLEEVQDNDGATDDGIVEATSTLDRLVTAIREAGGPEYQYRSVDPEDGMDGGEPGGNIRSVFLFRGDRGLTFVDKPGAQFDTSNAVVEIDGSPALLYSPGRIEPSSAAFARSRKPLVAEFRFKAQPLFVVAVHFASKLGDRPLFGRFQPAARTSEAQRVDQARVVARFVDRITAIDPGAFVIVMGDLNDTEYSPPADALRASNLVPTITALPPEERYSYVFEGNALELDHIFVSPSLTNKVLGTDVVHANAEFSIRASDHDPVLVRFALAH